MGWSGRGLIPGIRAAVLLLVPGVIAAQAPPGGGRTDRTEVVRLRFNGVRAVEKDELRNSLATEQSHCISALHTPICWISKSRYFYEREYLDHAELARDVLRARVFYWKRGYRETQVDTAVTPRGDARAEMAFNITEGPPTLISEIQVTQALPVLTNREVRRRLTITPRSPLDLIKLDSSLTFLQQSLWNLGYADALLDTAIAVDTASHTARVEISLDPRWIATVSDIIVEGNDKVETRIVLNSLRLRPGDLFLRSELLRSQRSLYESNLFKRAAITIPRQSDSAKVLIVSVQEAPLREARISAGFNTIDFAQVEGRFTHYNFRGNARRLEATAAVGNLLASTLSGRFIFQNAFQNVSDNRDRYLAPTFNASLSLRQPWFRGHDNELAAGIFAHRRSAPGIYVDRGFGSSATFTREVLERAFTSASYRFEVSRVDAGDIYFCVNFGLCDQPTLAALRRNQKLSPFTLALTINRADDPLSPTRGYRGSVDAEHASAFTASDYRYNRATADVAAYLPYRSRGTLAGRVRVGWVHSLASTSDALRVDSDASLLHPRKRFYAGGSRSVRGYAENQLGPRVLTIPSSRLRESDPGCTEEMDIRLCDPNAEGLGRLDFETRPLGGNLLAEASAELRFPLWQNLFGAAFADAAYVSQRTNPGLPTRRAALTPGFGVRYRSPVGPIRVDIGINPGLTETIPVVTETATNGDSRLVTLQEPRRFSPVRGGIRGVLDRAVLHLSIGEAF